MVEVYKRDVYKTEKIVKAISTLCYDNRCVYGARRMQNLGEIDMQKW